MVCVCNATYCDNFPALNARNTSQIEIYESTQQGARFRKSVQLAQSADFNTHSSATTTPTIRLTIDSNQTFQKIIGFGGAFTDAAGINVLALGDKLANDLIDSYYGLNGLQYTIGRVPIGGTDFSTRKYTYNDGNDGDFNLTHFALQPEDTKYKVKQSNLNFLFTQTT